MSVSDSFSGCMFLACLQLVAQRPAWEVGAKAALSLKRSAQAPSQQAAAPAPAAASAWKISAGDEDELLDDDQLLTEEDRARPAAPAGRVVPGVWWRGCEATRGHQS